MKIILLDKTDSTNKVAYRYALDGAPHGTCIAAKVQNAGRGRMGRTWHSAQDLGLYCSVIVRPKFKPVDYPKLTMIAGLAVAQEIDRASGLNSKLKWPNDVFINGKKCCGILVESSPLHDISSDKKFAIIGIGVNVNQQFDDFPDEIKDIATSLFIESKKKNTIYSLNLSIVENLLRLIEYCEDNGFSKSFAFWSKKDFLLKKTMRWSTVDDKIIEGRSLGVNEDGELRIMDNTGKVHPVLSGDLEII